MTPTSLSHNHQPIRTLWICSIWIGTWSLPIATAQPELTFPYVAYVNASSANIHSGPGKRHYPTATLPVGFAVHVYRHDTPQQRLDRASPHTENTWCAIRPPEGSISWIDSQQVRKQPDGTAEILGNQTLVRVGSQLSAKQDAVQVALSHGELVKLTTSGVASNERWLAIEPPAGEFRWILASQLSRQPLQGTQSKQRNVSQGQSLWKSQHEARAARQARQETHSSAISDRPSVAPSSSQPHTHKAPRLQDSQGRFDPYHCRLSCRSPVGPIPATSILVRHHLSPSFAFGESHGLCHQRDARFFPTASPFWRPDHSTNQSTRSILWPESNKSEPR